MTTEIPKTLMKKAGALMAKRAYSREALRERLAGLAGNEQVESVLNRLERLNLLNDAQYAYNFARRKIQEQGWSPARVRNALRAHQIEEPVVQSALDQILSELDDATALGIYLEKRFSNGILPAGLKGIRRLIAQLRNKGFEDESILIALRGKVPAEDLQHFETGE